MIFDLSFTSVSTVGRVSCSITISTHLVASNVAPVVLVAETGALNVSAVRELTVILFLSFGVGGGVTFSAVLEQSYEKDSPGSRMAFLRRAAVGAGVAVDVTFPAVAMIAVICAAVLLHSGTRASATEMVSRGTAQIGLLRVTVK